MINSKDHAKTNNFGYTVISILSYFYYFFSSLFFTIGFDIFLVFFLLFVLYLKIRSSRDLFPILIALIYFLSSVILGEYLLQEQSVLLMEAKFIYPELLRITLFFLATILLFINGDKSLTNHLKFKNNSIVFYFLVFFVVLIGFVSINRSNESSYYVAITPLYEYSVIIFGFLFLYSGKDLIKKIIATLIALFFIFQDFYYGGRITSVQIIITLYLFYYKIVFSRSLIKFVSLSLVLVFLLIGFTRTGQTSIFDFNFLSLRYLISDTATHSYYASASHIAALQDISSNEVLNLFYKFIRSLFGLDSYNLTAYINDNYYVNVGGGMFFSHGYFYFQELGVFLFSFFAAKIINLRNSRRNYLILFGFFSIIFFPRWFLYSPIVLIRGAIFFPLIFFIGVSLLNEITQNRFFFNTNNKNYV